MGRKPATAASRRKATSPGGGGASADNGAAKVLKEVAADLNVAMSGHDKFDTEAHRKQCLGCRLRARVNAATA